MIIIMLIYQITINNCVRVIYVDIVGGHENISCWNTTNLNNWWQIHICKRQIITYKMNYTPVLNHLMFLHYCLQHIIMGRVCHWSHLIVHARRRSLTTASRVQSNIFLRNTAKRCIKPQTWLHTVVIYELIPKDNGGPLANQMCLQWVSNWIRAEQQAGQ